MPICPHLDFIAECTVIRVQAEGDTEPRAFVLEAGAHCSACGLRFRYVLGSLPRMEPGGYKISLEMEPGDPVPGG